VSATPAEEPKPAGGDEDPTATRERERMAHYQKELAYRERRLAEHQQEAFDGGRALQLEATIRKSMGASEGSHQGTLKAVDCRTKSCVVTLTFPSPAAALDSMRCEALPRMRERCTGLVAIPTPPTNDGPYDLSVIYDCQ
jgi:hypothetical protein